MSKVGRGLLAGLAATVVLSALMAMKSALGVLPALHLPRMIAGMLGSPDAPRGWGVHILVGVVGYGLAMALLGGRLPGSSTVQGMLIASAGWLWMMVMLMPLVGAGVFGLALGPLAPVLTLVMHLVFGAVLGWCWGRLDAHGRHALAG